jgi:hypothetical protein
MVLQVQQTPAVVAVVVVGLLAQFQAALVDPAWS